MAIGIDEETCEWIHTWYVGKRNTKNYAYEAWNQKIEMFGGRIKSYGCLYDKPGDIVKMIYNTANATLSYCVNGIDQGIAFENVWKERGVNYRLAIYLNGEGTSVELIDFCTRYAKG